MRLNFPSGPRIVWVNLLMKCEEHLANPPNETKHCEAFRKNWYLMLMSVEWNCHGIMAF